MGIELIQIGISQGLILAILAVGVMIPFRFLNFPDLTAEGAYPLGGAICASLMIAGYPQLLAMLMGILGGGILAICTSQIALRLKVNSLLAGILVSTMAYSVNLRIMGKPNIALFNISGFHFDILSLMAILLLCALAFLVFLYTDYGLRFRAIGMNAQFATHQGIRLNRYTTLGLFIAGALFGLAGSLMVQIQQYMDIGMGVGIVIHGLASLMIGEALIGNNTLVKQLAAPILGALLYQQVQGFALSIGLAPSDLKLFTGSIVLIVLSLQKRKLYAKG